MNIDLQIDELMIDGIDVQDTEHMRVMVSAELARLLSEGGVPPTLIQGGDVAALTGGPITVEPGATAESVGSQIARAVYGGLGGE